MRPHCAIYVDAGYLLAAAATRTTGTSLRSGIHVEYAPLIRALADQVQVQSELPLLRIHWYDSARDGVPDTQQERIGELPQVKLRLGRFGMDGQQKGVDLRIGLDLVNHARHRAADVFFLLSGDDDLSEAVEEAQAQGVQVIVLAVPTREGKPHGVSRHLIRAADSVVLLSAQAVDGAVTKVEVPVAVPAAALVDTEPPPSQTPAPTVSPVPTPNDLIVRPRSNVPAPPPPPRSTLFYTSSSSGLQVNGVVDEWDASAEDKIHEVASNVLTTFRESATPEDMAALERAKPSIPREVDRALLADLSDALEVYDLSDALRYRLRECFWELFESRP